MSIMDRLFGAAPQQPQQNQQQPNMPGNGNPANMNQQVPTQQGTKTDPNGIVPAGTGADSNNQNNQNQNQNSQNQSEKSPLDQFTTLWDTPTGDNVKNPNAPIFQNIDPQKIMEAAKKSNFSQLLSAEMKQKIAAGGEGAVDAMFEAMNTVGQAALGQSAIASTKMIEAGIEKALKDKIPDLIRSQNANESIRNKNPLFDNPAVKPLISMVSQQLQVKFPNASNAELANMAGQYVEGLSKVFTPVAQESGNTPSSGKKTSEQDWTKFFE